MVGGWEGWRNEEKDGKGKVVANDQNKGRRKRFVRQNCEILQQVEQFAEVNKVNKEFSCFVEDHEVFICTSNLFGL